MDFSKLTNDQLVELVRALCYEAAQRGWATQQAAQAAMLDEAEKARIAADAAAREAERLREAEAQRIAAEAAARVRREAEAAMSQAEAARRLGRDQRRAALAEAAYEIFSGNCTINLWAPRDNPGRDRRVYFDEGDGHVRNGWKVCVHLDGSARTRPETVEGASGAKAQALLAIAKIALAQGLDQVRTKVYRERDDLARGGSYRAEYEPILAAYRAEMAEIERQRAEKAERAKEEDRLRAAARAQEAAAFEKNLPLALAPLTELATRHGCTIQLTPKRAWGTAHIEIQLPGVRATYSKSRLIIIEGEKEHEALATDLKRTVANGQMWGTFAQMIDLSLNTATLSPTPSQEVSHA